MPHLCIYKYTASQTEIRVTEGRKGMGGEDKNKEQQARYNEMLAAMGAAQEAVKYAPEKEEDMDMEASR